MRADQLSKLPLLVHASRSFRIRCLIDAQADIEKAGALTREEYNGVLKVLLKEETRKALLLREMERVQGEVPMDKLLGSLESTGIPRKEIVSGLFQLAVEGFLSCRLDAPGSAVFSFVTSDSNKVEPVYVPVRSIDDGKACSGCGTCQAACPVDCIRVDDGKVAIDLDKCIRCGLCYTACPRAFLPKLALDWAIKNAVFTPEELKAGNIVEAWSARTTRDDIRPAAQDGGITSSLLVQAFQAGVIQAAIGAGRHADIPWKPEPVIMKSIPDVVKAAGTKYVNTPSLKLLRAVKGVPSIAVVGTPCMMQALRKAEIYPTGTIDLSNIKYRIGIFCMESFTHAGIKQLCESTFNVPLEQVKKMNIKEGQFFANPVTGDPKSASMKDVTKLARLSCHCCYDLTSEMADISVGSIGSPEGWNSVIIRTAAGKQLFDAAVQAGLIEKKPIEEVQPGLGLLKKLSFGKKRNYEKEENKRDGEKSLHPWYFMKLPPPPPPKKKEGATAEPESS